MSAGISGNRCCIEREVGQNRSLLIDFLPGTEGVFMILMILLLGLFLPLEAAPNSDPAWYYIPSRVTSDAPTNCRPRMTDKLHIDQFFALRQAPLQSTQTRLFHNLLHALYGNQPIFHANPTNPLNKTGIEQLFAQIKDVVATYPPEYRLRSVNDLASVDLGDEHKQFIFFLLLRGGAGELIRGAQCRLPSILNYISLKRRSCCLDIYLAPKPLLVALFGSETVANDVLYYRDQILSNSKLDPLAAEQEFRNKFAPHLPPDIEQRFVSFRVPSSMLMPKTLRSSDFSHFTGPMSREYWNEESYHCCAAHFDDTVDVPYDNGKEGKIISSDLSIPLELLTRIPAKGAPCDDCAAPSIYNGYLDRDHRKYIQHLVRELRYARSHQECSCYWPELSEEAEKISEEAYAGYKDLVTSSPLADLLSRQGGQKEFLEVDRGDLNAHGVAVALTALQFRFSDFYLLHEELCGYARREFGRQNVAKYLKIKEFLHSILESLYPKFVDLYTHCLAKHPNPDIERELLFMKLLVGDESALELSTDQASPPIKKGGSLHSRKTNAKGRRLKITKGAFVAKDAFQIRILLEKGALLNDLHRYDESIKLLTEVIRIDSCNIMAYIERAYAYLETDQRSLALHDYKQIKSWSLPPFRMKGSQIQKGPGFWYTNEEQRFIAGMVEGMMVGTNESIKDFIPSLLNSFSGITHGLWAFVSHPINVSRDFTLATYAIGEYCYDHYEDPWIQSSVAILGKLADEWGELASYDQGHQLGYLIGKYGVDLFAPAGACERYNITVTSNELILS